MRFFIHLFYLFYVLSGGFRHYAFNLIFAQTVSGTDFPVVAMAVPFIEQFCMVLVFGILLFPLQKQLHLLLFCVLFVLDVFFQNAVGFTSCFILPHFFPLFFFLLLHFKNDVARSDLVRTAAILFVSVGFLTSFSSKMESGWYRWSDPVIYSYIVEFYDGYQIPSLASGLLLNIKSHLFWKLADYSVLLFQGAFLLVFIRKNFFYPLTMIAVLFHIGIVTTLGIGVVFYLYILFYALIFFVSGRSSTISVLSVEKFKIYTRVVSLVLFTLFAFSRFDVHYFSQILSTTVFTYIDYFFASICIVTYIFCYHRWLKGPTATITDNKQILSHPSF